MNIQSAKNPYSACTLCRRSCMSDRSAGQLGFCQKNAHVEVSRAALHFWEEPCISGSSGSGAVFFTGCSIGCLFCQNAAISSPSRFHLPNKSGAVLTEKQLADTFLSLQEKGACNINLVTGTHYIPSIAKALMHAKDKGLTIPVVYNTGNYETQESLSMLDGLVDIYLPDLKFFDPNLAGALSGAEDLFTAGMENIRQMLSQVGPPVFASAGKDELMQKGVLVRHLVLPGHTKDSLQILSNLKEVFGNDIYVSIMKQYTPMPHLTSLPEIQEKYPELLRGLTKREYEKVISFALSLQMEQAFIQEGAVAKESFIPAFDYTGVTS